MTPTAEILIITSVIAIACAIPGVFLVLRRVSLMSDAISHSILLGIVLAFFFTENIASPLLLVGATLVGVLTVSLTELIIRTQKVKEDAAIGLVFPLLFSIAVILISKFAGNVHLDTDAVLLGEVAFAPFDRMLLFGFDLPKALWVGLLILGVNVLFLQLFYKELKISTFDAGLAASLGFAPVAIHYGIMTLVSVTAVAAFDVVGSILVVALIIAPPAAAYLLTDRLGRMIVLSSILGVLSSLLGYGLARIVDASIAGSIATVAGLLFILCLLFAPERGLLRKLIVHNRRKTTFALHMLLIHLLAHEGTPKEKVENTVSHAKDQLNWSGPFSSRIVSKAVSKGYLEKNADLLKLTLPGKTLAKQVMVNI